MTMTEADIPEFNEDYPNYGDIARAWAERIPTQGDVSTAELLGPALRALTYGLLDAGQSVSWSGGAIAEAVAQIEEALGRT
jgi:hypothetical protein